MDGRVQESLVNNNCSSYTVQQFIDKSLGKDPQKL